MVDMGRQRNVGGMDPEWRDGLGGCCVCCVCWGRCLSGGALKVFKDSGGYLGWLRRKGVSVE